MTRSYYVTTPIYYANAEPHIGHTYTTVVADTLVRWHQLLGDDAYSVSGTDEHGEKIVEVAQQRNLTPKALVDEVSTKFRNTWKQIGIGANRFVRTTDPDHARNVQSLLQKVYDAGWIDQREYQGLYCIGCERFLTERDLVDGKCRDHEREPELRREKNYFFRMSHWFGRLQQHIESNPTFIQPDRYRNETLSMLREESGLGDLSISRPKSRLSWGIELPFDREHVCYVWFDALISYLTGAGYPADPKFRDRWSHSLHLIGKDILKPHTIFWPTMLWAMDLEPPREIRVHGYWQVDSRKVSKSLGNMVSPLAIRDKYGFEVFRYFLLREMGFGLDAGFSEEALVERANAELSNNLGNLVSRTLTLITRFSQGSLPVAGPGDSLDQQLHDAADAARDRVRDAMRAPQPHRALESIMTFSSFVNEYLDGRAPWRAMKDPSTRELAGTTLHFAGEALRVLAVLVSPFLPEASARIAASLGRPSLIHDASSSGDFSSWAQMSSAHRLLPGTRVQLGDPLFPRLELRPEA
jgi:methionyl-tRNA synthetase